MELTCTHCQFKIHTLLIGEQALADICNKLSTHISSRHPHEGAKMVVDLGKLSSLAVFLIMISKHTTLLDEMENVDIGKDEDIQEAIKNPIMEQFSACVEEIEEILGVEVYDSKPEINWSEYEYTNQNEYGDRKPTNEMFDEQLEVALKEGRIRKMNKQKFLVMGTPVQANGEAD